MRVRVSFGMAGQDIIGSGTDTVHGRGTAHKVDDDTSDRGTETQATHDGDVNARSYKARTGDEDEEPNVFVRVADAGGFVDGTLGDLHGEGSGMLEKQVHAFADGHGEVKVFVERVDRTVSCLDAGFGVQTRDAICMGRGRAKQVGHLGSYIGLLARLGRGTRSDGLNDSSGLVVVVDGDFRGVIFYAFRSSSNSIIIVVLMMMMMMMDGRIERHNSCG